MQSTAARESTLPAHVPAALFWDYDVGDVTAALADPFHVGRMLYDGPEIVWAKGAVWGMSGWLPTRFNIVDEVFRDHIRFTAKAQSGIDKMLGVDWPLNPIEIDPPLHGVYRRILQPRFQPSVMKRHSAELRTICTALIDQFADAGGCDVVAQFSTQFPARVFLLMMGMPLDLLDAFRALEKDFMLGETPGVRAAAARGIMNWMKEIAEAKRRAPADDLISYIVSVEVDGRQLNEGEVLGMCMLLYFGGLDTVISHLGWYIRHLALNPDLQDQLRAEPAKIPQASEELSRLYGSTGTMRTVIADCNFHGVKMRAGDPIALPVYLANRDPAAYDQPDEFILGRSRRSLTFATGAHNCLGIHLAKQEIDIVLGEFLARFDNISIADGANITWHTRGGSWGLDSLPLTWTTRA